MVYMPTFARDGPMFYKVQDKIIIYFVIFSFAHYIFSHYTNK